MQKYSHYSDIVVDLIKPKILRFKAAQL